MSTAATNPDKATQFGAYVGLLCVSLFVAACWVLICILLTPLGGDPEIARMAFAARWWLIAFGLGLDGLVSGFGCFAVYASQRDRQAGVE
jgi:hypothetical protein